MTGLSCRPLAGLALPLLVVAAAWGAPDDADQAEFFEKQVRPILVRRCYECHSATTKEPKGGLRVDSRAALLKGGDTGPAVVPGDLKRSLLIDAVNYGELYQMPPKTRLPADEVAALARWVERGAVWPNDQGSATPAGSGIDLAARKAAHWSWQPVREPPLPSVKNAGWVRQPLDRFILARLEAEGFAPSPAADKRLLARRAWFDLVGLPPSAQELEPFLADDSPQAFEKLVDRLLDSPQFGERWARHWLDLVRYAESRGHEFDYNIPNAWQYRDYVIRALNADVPYDQFVREHLAGDLLPQPRLHPTEKFNESILGTGFWFLGEWVHSPVDIRKDETDRFDNMVDVFSKTFLGLTVACARCHDHKFDAITQADYYALFGYLQSSGYRQARFDTLLDHERIARALAELDARHAPQLIREYAAARRPQVQQLAADLLAAREALLAGGEAEHVAAAAKARQREAARIGRFVELLKAAQEKKDDLLHAVAITADAKLAAKPAELAKKLAAARPAPVRSLAEALAGCEVIADYTQGKTAGWWQDGVSFGLGPIPPGTLLLSGRAELPLAGATLYGAARRDPTWNGLRLAPGAENIPGKLSYDRAGKTLRTATFACSARPIHCLVKGVGHLYAAVDSHATIHGPLHGQLVKETGPDNSPAPRWVSLDLKAYQGHRAHLELTPRGDEDFQVLLIVQADKPPAWTATPPQPLAELVPAEGAMAAEELARQTQDRALAALDRFAAGGPSAETDAPLLPGDAALVNWLLAQDELWQAPSAAADRFAAAARDYVAQRERLTAQIRRDSRLAPAMWEGSPEDERLLIRGNARTPGAIVPRRFLTALEGEQSPAATRLDLAERLLDPANPYVARVLANRVWHHLLGRGLVPSVDNLGVLGQAPTHPELLDHLAVAARREGWSLKRLIRTIVLSATYQQASTPQDARAEERDPQNLLWRRALVRRLEGEAIRDALLKTSGRLDPRPFGPSVPIHLSPFQQGRGRPGSGPLDGDGRRSVYLSVRRNFLSAMMLAFNAPIPFSTVGRRNVSNVPAQALILMNDPFVVQQAQQWGGRIAAAKDASPEERVRQMYVAAFARPPTSEETADALAFVAQQAAQYGLAGGAAADARPWGDLGHVLFNAKEFVFLQ